MSSYEVQRAHLIVEPVQMFTHPILLHSGGLGECQTERPAGRCHCGAFALDWMPLPEPKRPA